MAASITVLSGSSNFGPHNKTARFFTDSLNYTFEGIQGNYFVRLHFYPLSFGNYNVNESTFDVVANGLKLVSIYFIKEYILPINIDVLVVEFLLVKGSLEFLNAIEIVPIVVRLFTDSMISRVGDNSVNLSGRGIQTMYRLNVGGAEIKSTHDSNIWRTWEVDSTPLSLLFPFIQMG
ncbi:hypothetical protein CMV_021481 [Castanea mollissima]|uniref:Malectin-like domain-containing protein n=1 Tax=Castanea mollissima TaxID=60419 RepID=A0A8J4QX51_9ROSI|nr:hypothetical protein CMV_021481 [Castanea mollissima]